MEYVNYNGKRITVNELIMAIMNSANGKNSDDIRAAFNSIQQAEKALISEEDITSSRSNEGFYL